jgi:hypothetical protein
MCASLVAAGRCWCWCCSRLPSAHTCFNHLLLPEYESLEQLGERFETAIAEGERRKQASCLATSRPPTQTNLAAAAAAVLLLLLLLQWLCV